MRKLFIFLFAGILTPALAQFSIQELVKKAGDAIMYPNHDELIIFDSTLVDMQETGLTYVHNHTLTKVLTAHGAIELSVVKYGYDPLSAFVEIKKAVI